MKTQSDLLQRMDLLRYSDGKPMGKDHPWKSPVPMPRTKIEGFLEEFQWVRNHVKGPIVQGYVSVAEAELIDIPLRYIERGDGDEKFQEKVFLLDESGNPVTAIGTKTIWRRKYWGFGSKIPEQRMVRFGGLVSEKTIREVLSIIGDKGDFIRIILSYWEYTQAVILYKLPKGTSIFELLRLKIEIERNSFRKEFEEI